MNDITVKELDALVLEMKKQREITAEADAKLTEENKKLAILEAKAVEHLDALGKDNYKSENGTIGFRNDWRFNLPADPDAWGNLFGYLKEKNLYDSMVTINSQKLNSFAKAEMKIAEEDGSIMDFKIPGLEQPKLYKKLTFRKA